eukprot:TRINITY_DN12834_c0_g1_i1.p1 TRINITY_DN12834_c0_g1~~TRINITY_DN12834_c0_g1_i1.p1  ORF type:complete len:498 (-),score=113.55 TRINITY_DN12834_c0_g1_i1:118-1587(-)
MIRRPPRSTQSRSSAASDVYKRQYQRRVHGKIYMSIDINLIREDKGGEPQEVIESEKKRFRDTAYISDLIELDKEWRKEKYKLDSLRRDYNILKDEIGDKKKKSNYKDKCEQEITQITKIKKDTSKQMTIESELKNKLDASLRRLGNIVHDSVPVSNSEGDNKIERVWGKPKEELKTNSTLGHLHHNEILQLLDAVDLERGARISDRHSYFLKGVTVLLGQALINYTLNFLSEHGYALIQTPFFMKKNIMNEGAYMSDHKEQLYTIAGEKTFETMNLVATPAQPLSALYYAEWLKESNLPLHYAGYASCFQINPPPALPLNKTEELAQFCVTKPEESWVVHEKMLTTAEEYYKSLGLPYRIASVVSGKLSNAAAKKSVIEVWFPGCGEYCEMGGCENYTDYVARGLGVRCGIKKSTELEKRYVHMLSCTLCPVQRLLSCILENYQTAKGVEVPKVLVKYMGGVELVMYKEELVQALVDKAIGDKSKAQA